MIRPAKHKRWAIYASVPMRAPDPVEPQRLAELGDAAKELAWAWVYPGAVVVAGLECFAEEPAELAVPRNYTCTARAQKSQSSVSS